MRNALNTNMPAIGSLIREIDVKMSQTTFAQYKSNARV